MSKTNPLRAALEDMVYQFGYDAVKRGRPAIATGGLSALEGAFDALGWDDPYVIPDPVWCDAPVTPRCPRRTTSGTPTPNGYKRFCHEHFAFWQKAQEQPPSADAVDPHASSTGKPSTRVKS
jgi:hypothetical protein